MIAEASPQRLLQFIQYLRTEDFCIGIKDSKHALQAVSGLTELDHKTSKIVMRSIACRNHDEWERFDKLFNQYWYPERFPIVNNSAAAKIDIRLRRRQENSQTGFAGTSMNAPSVVEDQSLKGVGAGKQNTITKADYRFITDKQQMRKLERLAEKLAFSLRKYLSRKKIYRKHGTLLEIRRTLRKNLTNAGLPINRIFRQNDLCTPDLVILHDISHSMSWSNPLLFRFARGLVRNFKTCEAFAFHTELFSVTELYRQQSLIKMREQLENNNRLWLGGTCIAKSINQFNRDFAKTTLKKNSIVIIISDGFDTDKPELLHLALETLSEKAKKIIWLSPVLERLGDEIDSETMLLAMDHIDALLPAHSIVSLEKSLQVIKQFI